MAKRGPQAGATAVARLDALIAERMASGEGLPRNGDALHIGQVCALVGVARSTVHQNPAFRARLEAYAAASGIAFSARGIAGTVDDAPTTDGKTGLKTDRGDQAPDETGPLRKRVQALESRVHELTARNGDLLKRNADLQARLNNALLMEHVLSTKGGRR